MFKKISGTRWFSTFIDDHTRHTWIYLLKEKFNAAQIFKNFHTMIQTHIQILRTNNAREYFNSILGRFIVEKGIIHQRSCANTPQKNGIAERRNKHLLEVA